MIRHAGAEVVRHHPVGPGEVAFGDLQQGLDAPGLETEAFRVRSVSVLLPREVALWPEAAREAMSAKPGRFFNRCLTDPV